jgi:hypothetical protein
MAENFNYENQPTGVQEVVKQQKINLAIESTPLTQVKQPIIPVWAAF